MSWALVAQITILLLVATLCVGAVIEMVRGGRR